MDLKTALDYAQSYHAKQVKPFEKLAEVLAIAVKAETLAADADKRKGEAEAAVIRAKDDLDRLKSTEQEAFASYKDANDKERRRLGDLLVSQNNQVSERLAELDTIRAKAIREHDAYVAGLQEQAKRIEADVKERTAKVQKDLEVAEKAYEAFQKKVGLK
jgi:hypothetical protein